MRNGRPTVADAKEEKKMSAMKKEAEVVFAVTSSFASEEPFEEEGGEEEEVAEEKEEEGIKGKENESSELVVGSGCFPMNRIKRIIRSEGDFRTTQEAVFLINNAAVQLLKVFCDDAYACSVQDSKKAVSYKHLSSVVCKRKRYDFLSDFVPEKIRAEVALAERGLSGT